MFMCFGMIHVSKIIAVTNQKGGVGKTTTCINLAGALGERGHSVIVADMNNEQKSACRWAERGAVLKNMVVSVSDKKPRIEIEGYKKNSDYLIIDTAPELTTPALKAILLSDIVIIPCTPSLLDIESAEDTIELIEGTGKPFVLLASCVRKGTLLSGQLTEQLKNLGQTFKTVIHQRVDIVEAAISGEWVGFYSPSSNSRLEYENLADEVIGFLNKEVFDEQKEAVFSDE